MHKSKHHHHHNHNHNGAAAKGSRSRMELNKNLSDMLVNWLNLLNLTDEKIQHLSDLKDGMLFYSIIKEMLKSRSDLSKPLVAFIESENTNVDLDERYDLIRTIMEGELQLNEGIDYELAKNGCEWELAKISLILLMNGVNNDIQVISNASDLLDSFQYQSVTNFYTLMDNQKLRVNNLTIKFYEDFLSMSENKRRSIAKENAPPLTPKSKFTGNYPTSPMQKISLNSPRDKCRRKAEEELALEKKKFDKELNDKEIFILELQYELKEKSEQISQYTYQLQECRRKMSELLNFKEKAEEYESLINKIDALEKEKKYYEEKLAKQTNELKELKELRELKQRNENQIQYLTSENTRLENKDRQSYTELTRLRKCEQSLAQANQLVEAKESTICELINKCSHLELSQNDLNAQFKKKKYELDEMIDDLNGQKAFLESEVNSLKARLATVQADGECKMNEYEARVNELTGSLESSKDVYLKYKTDAEKAISKLEETLKRLSDEKARLEARNNEISIELNSLKDELENSTKRIANSSAKLREQAEQIVQLQAQYSELERKYQSESEQGKKEVGRLNKSLDTRQNQIDELKEQLNTVESQLKEKTFQFEKELADFKAQNQKLTETLENRNSQIQLLKNNLSSCELELNEKNTKIADLTMELSNRINDVKLLEEKVKGLDRDLAEARINHQNESEMYQAKLNELNDQLAGKNRQLDELRDKLEETSSHLYLLREQSANEREQSEQDKARLEEILHARQTLIDELKHSVEQLEVALNDSRTKSITDCEQFNSERDKFSKQLAVKEVELGEMKEKIVELGQLVSEASTQLQTKSDDYEREKTALGESLRQREQRVEELTRNLAHVEAVLADTVAQSESQRDSLEREKTQLSTELDAKMSELSRLGQKLDDMKRQLEEFNDRRQDDTRQYESVKSQLEESLKLKQNEIDSLAADLQLIKDKCSQQDADKNQLSQSNELLRVEIENKQTQLDELKVYIGELEVQLNERGKKIDDLTTELTGKASDFTKLEQYLNDVQKDREEESKQYELEMETYKADAARVRSELEVQLTALKDQLVNSEETSVKLKQDYEEQLGRLRETNEQEKKTLLGELEDAYSECKAKLDENYKLQNELAKLDELNREYNTKQEQAEKMLNEMQSSYNNEKVKLTQEIKSLKTTLAENKTILDEMNATRSQLDQKLQQVLSELTLKNESIGRLEMDKAQLEKTNAELGSVKDNMLYQIENNNKQLIELKQHLTSCQNEINAKQNQLNEKQTQLQTIELHRVNLEKEYANVKQSFDGLFKERTQILAELTEKNKKLMDMEIGFNQALTNETNKIRDDFQQVLKNHQEHIVKLETRVMELTKEKESERERVSRSREEISLKQNELEMIQKKLKLSEEKEKTFANKLEFERDRLKSLNEMLEKDKQQIIKLNCDLESKIKLNEELTAQNKSLRDYSSKYEEHYKQKKRIFEETDALNKDLKAQLEQSDRDLNELKMKVIQNEGRNRALVDELNFLKEKIKTVSFENQHLKSTKEDLMKKLSGVTMTDSQFESASVKFAKPTVLSTPKGKCSFDDSYVKYTSPEMRTSEMFFDTTNQDEMLSRRFSIDSFSRSSINAQSQNATMMPQFNRFTTISENEFEEPDINRKSLHIEHPSTNVNRLSTLLIRNQQAKPHLKCSYALESMLPDVPEDQIKGRENKQPQPLVTSSAKKSTTSTTGSYQKRRNDDPPESNSPKKSHMAGIKQTHF